jgi:hypothetical protein
MTADWATGLALDIAADVYGRPHVKAIELISARLRLVRLDGELSGATQALEVVRNGERGKMT